MFNKYKKELLLVVVVLVYLAPVLIYQMPLYYFSPDFQYVKAKFLRVAAGDLFEDPVTGFPSFHPPFYHMILAAVSKIGIGIDTLLYLVTIFNTLALFVFSYLILREVFEEATAFCATLLVPFIFRNMGPGQVFLPTAFYFSLPFFLAGLWLYLQGDSGRRIIIGTSLLWGISFLISPVYFFVIGLVFLHELVFKRDIRKFLLYSVVFLVVISPFIYQTLLVSRSSMTGTRAFALWRGIPDREWWTTFVAYLLSPVDNKPLSWPVLPMLIVLVGGIIGYLKLGKKISFLIIAAVSFLLTAYHFNPHYASRIEYPATLILGGYAVAYLFAVVGRRLITVCMILVMLVLGLIPHLKQNFELYNDQNDDIPVYRQVSGGLRENLGRFVDPDDFVLASDKLYRDVIMIEFPVHGLLAYKTGEYFQLNSKIATEMHDDYLELMGTDDISLIEHFCRKYNIKIAVVGLTKEADFPAFRTIARHWEPVYEDVYFVVYRRPI